MAIAFSLALYAPAQAAPLTCENGSQPLCLSYGEKVVGNNSVCFDRFQCNDDGFVCKSELDGLAEEHQALLAKHNDLVKQHNELVGVYDRTASNYQRYVHCVSLASTLQDAQGCKPES